MATWLNLSLQDSPPHLMEQLFFLHDQALMIMLMIIITAVLYTTISIIQNTAQYSPFEHTVRH